MAQCKNCGEKGWFLRLSEFRLCNACHPHIAADIKRRMDFIFKESADIVNHPLSTQAHRLDPIKRNIDALCEYEKKSIVNCAVELLDMYNSLHEEIIAAVAKEISE